MEYYLEKHYIGNDEAIYYLCKGDKVVLAEFYDEQLANKVLEFLNANTARYFLSCNQYLKRFIDGKTSHYDELAGWESSNYSLYELETDDCMQELSEQEAREQFPDAFKQYNLTKWLGTIHYDNTL